MRGLDMDSREKIENLLTETLGFDKNSLRQLSHDFTSDIMKYRVHNILLLSTAYDLFLLEEEGRLRQYLRMIYHGRDEDYVPTINHVLTAESALEVLKKNKIDLIVVFNHPTDTDVISLAREVKGIRQDVPLIFLANNTPELDRIAEMEGSENIDRIFTWYGDGKIFLSIVQYIEDTLNVFEDSRNAGVRIIILTMDSIQSYSACLPILHEEIWNHTKEILGDELTVEQRSLRQSRRPRVLLATTFEEANKYYQMYKKNLLFLTTTMRLKRDGVCQEDSGITLTRLIHEEDPDLPIMILSSDDTHLSRADDIPGLYLDTRKPTIFQDVREYFRLHLGLRDLTIKDNDGKTISHVHNMRTFRKALWKLPGHDLRKYLDQGILSNWLISRTEFELAEEFRSLAGECGDGEIIRAQLLQSLDDRRKNAHKGVVIPYSRKAGSHVRFSRLCSGALGGKARGLAFMDKILSKFFRDELYPDVHVTIPYTLVLATDAFDAFIRENDLMKLLGKSLTDDRIAGEFMTSDLPTEILGDLRSFIGETKGPIVVRSSSLLEDALFQPFAGVYASFMLPNNSNDVDERFRDLCNAIKYVYASTYFRKARDYIKTTPNRIEDEKMAVIIQKVVGQQYGNWFYSTISGVAKSYNYYPVGRCRPEDGIVNLALGFGKTIVDGGTSYRFCPLKPNVPLYGTIRNLLDQSQKRFYAISLSARTMIAHQDEDGALVSLDIGEAEKHGTLDYLASTYDAANNRLSSGIFQEGPRVIDFSPLIQYGKLPIAEIIQLLLRMCELALGCPVEIEFAVNIHNIKHVSAEFSFLQVRSMVARDDIVRVGIHEYEKDIVLCSSKNVLGNGIRNDLHDIVFVKPDCFDLARTQTIVPQIRRINSTLRDQKRPYVLIGPGRWGSSDPWLGIPVAWSDIAGAGVVVETPIKDRYIDPSEGSHFFHNMTSSKVGYFTVFGDSGIEVDWDWLNSLNVIMEMEDVRHVRVDAPLETRIDGRTRQGIILKRPQADKRSSAEADN